MTRPVIVYGDDERELVAYLQTELAARNETFMPSGDQPVGTKFPGTLTDEFYVQVAHETTPADGYPARGYAQTRVICWAPATRRTDVKALASIAHGVAQTMPPSEAVGSVRSLLGPSAVTEDPDTQNLSVWFLLTVNLRGNQES